MCVHRVQSKHAQSEYCKDFIIFTLIHSNFDPSKTNFDYPRDR